jgi:hypothetical protein
MRRKRLGVEANIVSPNYVVVCDSTNEEWENGCYDQPILGRR